jgi:hypothetical protein
VLHSLTSFLVRSDAFWRNIIDRSHSLRPLTISLLIVIPVLMLGERPIHARYAEVAHHFEIFPIPDNELSRFQSQWRSHERSKDSTAVRVMLMFVTYALAAWLSEFLRSEGSEFLTGGEAAAVSGFSRWPVCGQYLSATQFWSTSRTSVW